MSRRRPRDRTHTVTRRHGGETGEKGVGRWWVMQCPASRGAVAPVAGLDALLCVPISSERLGGRSGLGRDR